LAIPYTAGEVLKYTTYIYNSKLFITQLLKNIKSWSNKVLYNNYLNIILDTNTYCTTTDINNIIILYPQATTNYSIYPIWGRLYLPNPNTYFNWITSSYTA
ncbi:unnamed protein product, partial [Clonostachys rhizophaga]